MQWNIDSVIKMGILIIKKNNSAVPVFSVDEL